MYARGLSGAARASVIFPCRHLRDELVQGEVGDSPPEPELQACGYANSHRPKCKEYIATQFDSVHVDDKVFTFIPALCFGKITIHASFENFI